jgi:tRNA threonylcarbamoyladenosine biosynthesis protein TsaB
MAMILALDTSTEACSCALQLGKEIVEDHAVVPRQHARLILPMVKGLLQAHNLRPADLDAWSFGRGPGSFTGLRIAAGVVQGLAFATGLPVIPVSTLASLALQSESLIPQSLVLACIDARIDEMYWGWFDIQSGMPVLIGEERLGRPELLEVPPGYSFRAEAGFKVIGNGLVYRERMPLQLVDCFKDEEPDILPRASAMVRLASASFARGELLQPEQVMPVYLRDKVTHQ